MFSLIGCPPFASAAYLLVRRDAAGCRHVLASERALSSKPTLNLARVRFLGANLGANEVHLFRLGASRRDCDDARADLTEALLTRAGCQPAP